MSELYEVEKKAREQAGRHYRAFMDDCEWPDMLEKYAEIANRYEKARKEVVDKNERGARIDASDMADVYYYEYFYELMAKVIADNTLVSEGYVQDKRKNWVLKSQPAPPPPPPKKKFGFWG